jgi:hypothetical protein
LGIVLNGRQTDIDYVVTHWVENRLFVLRGQNKVLRTLKRFTIRDVSVDAAHPHATKVTFTGDYDFLGATRYVSPLLTRAMEGLVAAGERGMESALTRL